MKKILLSAPLILASVLGFTQDVIVKANGKEIKSKMVEVTNDEVKFKIYDINDKQISLIKNKIKELKKHNLDPAEHIFSIPKKDVFFIAYENGNSEIFREKIPIEAVDNAANFMDVDKKPEAYKSFRKARKNYSTATGLIYAGGGIAVFGLTAFIINSTDNVKDKTKLGASYIYMGAGAILVGTGLPIFFNSKKKMNIAFDNYKNSLKTSQNQYMLNFGLTSNGLGMNIKF